ncbi:Nse1 non-SMC component of SMC5-6 complex-domain-containing protein [Dactylonectria macrodidyma]|uniref:Non-structural maintenance of chromosomes element 1 homolog n=1 Tax=Dactylonectria macrodidyma TaxID=307937 RepID=A0A9P9EFE9_9HYPO|nr:Nse1 non-SMC component of SMC5-6 complex-domain-containing protein [Dactylonectria macrodidyma]
MGDSRYSDGNRAFLQALLARGTMTFEEARPVLAEIFTADRGDDTEVRPDQVTQEEFNKYIDIASEAVSLFDYEIRSTIHQVTKKRIYALVNTTSDPQTQLATTYSADELSFIKRILDNMFEKYNTPRMEVLAVTEMQAIKQARPDRRQSRVDPDAQTQTPGDKGLKHSEVESVLASLVEGGWFEKSEEAFYSLSPRALLELRPWLVETYNDADADPNEWQRIKFCEACKDIVTVGLRCVEQDCNFRLHDICEEAFWRTRREKKCIKCSTQWTGEKYTGERAVTMTEAFQRGRRRGGGWRRSTLAEEVIREVGGGEEDADADDE